LEKSSTSDTERRELRILVEDIKSKAGCVLVLGPSVAIRANDPDRRPLDELLARELYASLDKQASEAPFLPPILRRAADLYYRHQGRTDLEVTAQDFYAREASSTTDFHRDLARLPFKLCVSASPDNLMLTAFKEAKQTRRPRRVTIALDLPAIHDCPRPPQSNHWSITSSATMKIGNRWF
jgi:hypothetical protein